MNYVLAAPLSNRDASVFKAFWIDDYLNPALALFATSFAYYLNLPFLYVCTVLGDVEIGEPLACLRPLFVLECCFDVGLLFPAGDFIVLLFVGVFTLLFAFVLPFDLALSFGFPEFKSLVGELVGDVFFDFANSSSSNIFFISSAVRNLPPGPLRLLHDADVLIHKYFFLPRLSLNFDSSFARASRRINMRYRFALTYMGSSRICPRTGSICLAAALNHARDHPFPPPSAA